MGKVAGRRKNLILHIYHPNGDIKDGKNNGPKRVV
jgi:hypothetical protein